MIYEDLGQTLNEEGLTGALAYITELLKQNRPGLVVIDSFRALQTYAADPETFRGFLHELAGRLSALPITAFWVGEYTSTDTSDAPEFAVADAIVSLGTEREADRDRRVLSVIKLRGSGSMSGKHAYRLSSAGIHVFPRMADPVELDRYGGTHERMSSGVPALDAMLSDGYYRGASTLLAGPSGIGKTLLALHFIFAGAHRGETGRDRNVPGEPDPARPDPARVLLVPGRSEYRAHVPHPGRSVSGRMGLRPAGHRAPHRRHQSRHRQPRRPASLLRRRTPFPRVHLLATATLRPRQRQRRHDPGSPRLFGVSRLSEYGISHLSDNVILLQFLRGDSQLKRALTILKARGSAHDQITRQYEITTDGIILGDQFDGSQDLT